MASVQEKIARAANVFEQVVIFKNGAQGLSNLTQRLGCLPRKLQNGWIQSYGLIFVVGWMALVIFLIFCGAKA